MPPASLGGKKGCSVENNCLTKDDIMFTYNLPDKYLKINASTLKWIACITMLDLSRNFGPERSYCLWDRTLHALQNL